MAALPRGDVVRFHSTLQYRFERVKEACGVLEAITKLESLDDYLDTLTPEWLKSLILHSPLFHGHDVTRIVENNDSCLTLLKKQQLGREDREKQQVIKTALEVAWNEWIKGASSCQNPINRESKKCKTFADEDSEAEYEWQVEEEHWDDDTEFETLTPYYYDSEKDAPVEVDNVWKLDPDGRRRLIIQSCSDRYVMAMEELKDSVKQYNVTRELYERMYQRKALEILKQAKIVAMTTTGAAIHQQLVSQLEAPVVFVEEAAEILESNLLAVLTPHVKNMVLIGDHKQLKPNLSWNRLERNKFNVSLFERLIKNDYPRTLLLRQNRMHRDLVPLYGYHYYSEKKYKGSKEILSSDKTEALEKPKCMAKNFFWWSYKDKYEKRHECSQYNEHEVEMVVRLCSWLVCNKVASSSVAVLTPYRGQLEKIEESLKDFAMKYKCMPSDLSLIPVYTVDEFQGHERDVVILSLVRSNSKGEIGFLSRFNRLVVGTSRQKCALYIVGNHTFLEKSSLLLWKGFIEKCKERDSESIGTGLPIIVSDNQQCVCQSPEDLDERVEKLLQIIANNATVEPDNGPSSLTSESTVSTPASVRSQPHRTSEHTLDDVQPHSVPALPPPVYTHTPRKDPLRQQSSPAILIPTPNQSAQVDSSTSAPSWNFHECLLELKDTDAITKWKFIGRRLALEEPTINSIEKRYERDIKEAFYQMMLEWKKCQGKEATCDKIIECLEKEQLKDVADKIRKYQVY